MVNKFKIGDRVRIVRTWPSYDNWENVWVGSMHRYVNDGKVYTIIRENRMSGFLLSDINRYLFPWQSLELVEGAKDDGKTPVERKILEIKSRREQLGYRW